MTPQPWKHLNGSDRCCTVVSSHKGSSGAAMFIHEQLWQPALSNTMEGGSTDCLLESLLQNMSHSSSSSTSSNMIQGGGSQTSRGSGEGVGQRVASGLLAGPAGVALRAAWRFARALLCGWRATATVLSSLAAATECLSARTMACTYACSISLC